MPARDLTSLKSLLPSILGRVARDTGSAKLLVPLWAEVVGDVAAHSSVPERWVDGELIVSVGSPEWAAELTRSEPELRARLLAKLPGARLTRIRFRPTGPVAAARPR